MSNWEPLNMNISGICIKKQTNKKKVTSQILGPYKKKERERKKKRERDLSCE